MNPGHIRTVFIPFVIVLRIMPVLLSEFILGFLLTLFTAIVLSGYVRIPCIVVKDGRSAFVTACAVVLVVLLVQQAYVDETFQIV